MNRMLLAALAVGGSMLTALPALASANPFLGEVATYSLGFCPRGWVPLDGRLLPISGHYPLFHLLGTTYGGDGLKTFGVPLAKQLFTLNPGQPPLLQCMAVEGIFPSRD